MTTGTIEKSGKNSLRPEPGKWHRPGSSGGNDEGRGGGGPSGGEFFEETAYPSNKYRILTWFLLLTVMMTFGGLIGAYVVVSTNGVLEWKPFNLPVQVWVSTVLILSSSVAYHLAHRSLFDGRQEKARRYYLATAILGGMFIASQLLVWLAIVQRGVYLQSNPYAGFFYILTAVHAIHVLGGIIALGYIVLRSWLPTKDPDELERRRVFSGPIGWYWHFMDVMWMVLLALLGFWK